MALISYQSLRLSIHIMHVKISASLNDSPVFSRLERFYKGFKEADVDGIELAIGFKTRFNLKHIRKLSTFYDLPITSVHQSMWSNIGWSLDEKFIEDTQLLGAKTFVFHPLILRNIDGKRMNKYFSKLSKLQQKHGIIICLENMKNSRAYRKIYADSPSIDSHLTELYSIAEQYGLYLTYDTSHGLFVNPFKEKSFKNIFPKVKNIHLSSFHNSKEHLPLTMGDFETKIFIAGLYKKNYSGLITLEVFYPRVISLRNYDFSAISDSVRLIKSVHSGISAAKNNFS